MESFELLFDEFIYLRENYLILEELKAHPSLSGGIVDMEATGSPVRSNRV